MIISARPLHKHETKPKEPNYDKHLADESDGIHDPIRTHKERTMPDPEHKPVPFYLQPGFKRSVGFVFLGIGQLVGGSVGLILQGIGGIAGAVGIADAARKSDPKTDGNKGIWYHITALFRLLINYLTKRSSK